MDLSALDVRACRAEDVGRLERWLPSGPTTIHARRFTNQEAGTSTFLIAWAEGARVASGEVRWDGFAAQEVRERLADLPELNGMQVWPAGLQGHGIGTALIRAAEELARARGARHLGMGVDAGNGRAAALYLRLGYADVGCPNLDRYHYISDDGVSHEAAEPCRVLVRGLTSEPA